MADRDQAATSETRISVDMNAADDAKAVTRDSTAQEVRERGDVDTDKPRTKAEKDLFKRMARLERNLGRQFDQQTASREAAHQKELSDLKAQVARLSVDRDGGTDALDAAHDAALKILKDKLAAAYEKGDSQASADITLEISQLDAKFWAKKAAAAGVVTREQPAAAAPAVASTQEGPRREKGPTPAGARFLKANEDWWYDPDFKIEHDASNSIYLDLVNNEGFDAKSDETYREVAKRLKAKFPKLEVLAGRRDPEDDEDPDASAGETRRERRPAAASRIEDRGDSGRQMQRSTNRVLTAKELDTMRACRLDPDNDRDVVQFTRELVAMEAAR